MVTAAQISATRSNAMKSAEPKSSTAKAIVSASATRRAILSDRLLVDGEPHRSWQLTRKTIAAIISQRLDLSLSARLSDADLVPFDGDREKWCEATIGSASHKSQDVQLRGVFLSCLFVLVLDCSTLSPRITAWRVEDFRVLIESGAA